MLRDAVPGLGGAVVVRGRGRGGGGGGVLQWVGAARWGRVPGLGGGEGAVGGGQGGGEGGTIRLGRARFVEGVKVPLRGGGVRGLCGGGG